VNVVCRRMSFAFVDFGDGVRKSPGSVYTGHNVPTMRILFLSLSLSVSRLNRTKANISVGTEFLRELYFWHLFQGEASNYDRARSCLTTTPLFFSRPSPARTHVHTQSPMSSLGADAPALERGYSHSSRCLRPIFHLPGRWAYRRRLSRISLPLSGFCCVVPRIKGITQRIATSLALINACSANRITPSE